MGWAAGGQTLVQAGGTERLPWRREKRLLASWLADMARLPKGTGHSAWGVPGGSGRQGPARRLAGARGFCCPHPPLRETGFSLFL